MQLSKTVNETLDAAGGATLIGVVAEAIPAILGVFAIGWYCMRIWHWYRVNYQGKEPWKGM